MDHLIYFSCPLARIGCGPRTELLLSFTDYHWPALGVGPRTGPPAPTITWITDEANLSIRIGNALDSVSVNLGGTPTCKPTSKLNKAIQIIVAHSAPFISARSA